jgi:hypothetical protein
LVAPRMSPSPESACHVFASHPVCCVIRKRISFMGEIERKDQPSPLSASTPDVFTRRKLILETDENVAMPEIAEFRATPQSDRLMDRRYLPQPRFIMVVSNVVHILLTMLLLLRTGLTSCRRPRPTLAPPSMTRRVPARLRQPVRGNERLPPSRSPRPRAAPSSPPPLRRGSIRLSRLTR